MVKKGHTVSNSTLMLVWKKKILSSACNDWQIPKSTGHCHMTDLNMSIGKFIFKRVKRLHFETCFKIEHSLPTTASHTISIVVGAQVSSNRL